MFLVGCWIVCVDCGFGVWWVGRDVGVVVGWCVGYGCGMGCC